MKEHSYKWLLNQILAQKEYFPILDAGFCHGVKLLERFEADSMGNIIKLRGNSTKDLLRDYLSKHSQASPFVCYLYHRKGLRLVSPSDAEDLIDHQLHGLQVTGLRRAVRTSHDPDSVFKVSAWDEHGSLQHSIKYCKFHSNEGVSIKEFLISEKLLSIGAILRRVTGKHIKAISFEAVISAQGTAMLLNLSRLKLFEGPQDFKSKPQADLSNEYSEGETPRANLPKLPKVRSQTNPLFLKMIASTFDKARKRKERHQLFQELGLRQAEKKHASQELSDRKKRLQRFKSKNDLASFEDLLFYVEKTRPLDWAQDSKKPTKIAKTYSIGRHSLQSSTKSHRKQRQSACEL